MYNHPIYSDGIVSKAKSLFAEYREKYAACTAIGRVADTMGIHYKDAASMIATKAKPVAAEKQLTFNF